MKMFKYEINKNLLPMKAHYFLWNAGTGPIVPFLSTYARQLGFSSVIVGLVYTILPICGMLAKPLFGAIADKFRCQKQIFLAAQLFTAAAFLAIFYAPEVPVESKVHFSCDYKDAVFDTSLSNATVDECLINSLQEESGIVNCDMDCLLEPQYWQIICEKWQMTQYCESHPDRLKFTAHVPKTNTETFIETVIFVIKNITMEDGQTHYPICSCADETTDCHITAECDVLCDDYTVNEIIAKSAIRDEDVYGLYQFWVFLLLMVLGWIGQAVVVSIGDTICFEMLGDKPNRYGYQRLFGALGWGIFSTISGILVDAFSEGQAKKNYLSAFYLAFIFILLDYMVSFTIKYTQKKRSASILRDLGRLLVDLRILIFLVWCVCVGMCTGLIWQFLFWLIEDLASEQGCESQDWIKTLEGLVMAIQCLLGELPFFFLSGSILKRIGHINSMTLVLSVIGVRYILYSVISNPWWFLPVELLNGLTFGLFYACMASYASIVAPHGTEATMQGMVGAIFEGVGVSLGSFVAGILYNEYGGAWTFRLFGIGALIACLLHAGVQYLIREKAEDFEANYSMPKEDISGFEFEDDDQQELTLVGG